jgi:hypothetical protein
LAGILGVKSDRASLSDLSTLAALLESSSIHSAVTGFGCGVAKRRVSLTITSTRPRQANDAVMMMVSGAKPQYQPPTGVGNRV